MCVIDSPPVCAFTGTSPLSYHSQSLYHSMLITLTQCNKNCFKIQEWLRQCNHCNSCIN